MATRRRPANTSGGSTPNETTTTRAPNVYVVQEQPTKNITSALRYGNIVPLLDPDERVMFNSAPTVRKLDAILRDYSDQDFILCIGSPAAIGIACAVAARHNEGRFRCLMWDRQEGMYYPISVDLEGAVNV